MWTTSSRRSTRPTFTRSLRLRRSTTISGRAGTFPRARWLRRPRGREEDIRDDCRQGGAHLPHPHGGPAHRRQPAADPGLGGAVPPDHAGAHRRGAPALLRGGRGTDPLDQGGGGPRGEAEGGPGGGAGGAGGNGRRWAGGGGGKSEA